MTPDPRHPLLTEAGAALHQRLLQHSDAPPWNYTVGDRVMAEDLQVARRFGQRLGTLPQTPDDLPLLQWALTVPRYRECAHLPWTEIPLSSRADLSGRLIDFVPEDADFSRLIQYGTSGTEGPSVEIPSHPQFLCCNHRLVEYALAQQGVLLPHGPAPVAAHVCAQSYTYTFASILSIWGGGGFVKVNLNARLWSHDSARRYLGELNPPLLTGDPVAFAEMLAWEIPLRPRAILSAAARLSTALATALRERYQCPVLDWYSLTETGPIACSIDGHSWSLLAPDLYVEILDELGRPLPDGQRGEVVVSGGRNPYLCLLRYRTGDYAVKQGNCLLELEGRRPVSWRAGDGSVVTPVDLARVMNRHVWATFAFSEESGELQLRIRPVPGYPLDEPALKLGLEGVLLRPVQFFIDPELGADGRKVRPWS